MATAAEAQPAAVDQSAQRAGEALVSMAAVAEAQPAAEPSEEEVHQLHDLTKRCFLAIVELERYSLNYRLASMNGSKLSLLQFAACQEAGVAGGLASIIGVQRQSALARKNPASVNLDAFRGALRTGISTTILASASSAVALSANMAVAYQNHRRGYSSAEANRFVLSHLAKIDQMLAERDKLIAPYLSYRYAPIPVQVGKILRLLRDGCLVEYANFNRDVRSYRTSQNAFLALNTATFIVRASAQQCVLRGLSNPRFSGPSTYLQVLNGAMVFATPLLSAGAGWAAGSWARHSIFKKAGGMPDYSSDKLIAAEKSLSTTISNIDPSERQMLALLKQSQAYSETSGEIAKELQHEVRVLAIASQVANQNIVAGTSIGALGASQGILGIVANRKISLLPAQRRNLRYYGTVLGTTANGVALGANTALLVFAAVYINHLHKERHLPSQLIKDQLEQLDKVEQIERNL
jgi:hypothetical protein